MILKQFLGLSHKLRPTVISSRMEKRKALLTENADQKKRLPDNLQKKLDETFLNMQLYEKALKLFEHDQSTSFYHKAIQAPGRVISVSISQLKDKRDEIIKLLQ
ncbi:E3 UFM1-protein ligase 1 homolog isoform X4 [Arachis hypogaea]|uniref:E3 UFM1-protein ligase 1 homolog isoform X4 n=1 Tax=Arachis hypogaea TaxID=3818 RepID=UPI003B2131BB